MSEYDLLQAFREERSEKAFEELVRRYAGLVYSVAKRRLGNIPLAEDAMQLVFIRFAKAPPKVFSDAHLTAWLHRTTLNVAVDLWRSEIRRRDREQQAAMMELNAPESHVWEEIIPKLDEALNQLSDDDRQALLLRFFRSKAMREVGVALGISEDAAKMRVSRAVDRLRIRLGAGGAACTAALLETLLDERSVEAAPEPLVSRLAMLKLPATAGTGIGIGIPRILKTNPIESIVMLTVIGIVSVYCIRSLTAPMAPAAKVTLQTNNTTQPFARIANRRKPMANGFNSSLASPPKPVKMWLRVLDTETGRALSAAKIQVAYFGVGGRGEGHDLWTDDRGLAAILEQDDTNKTQGMNVFVVAEAHVPKAVSFRGESLPSKYIVKLDPAMTAGGTVVDEQSLPVAGVQIMIQSPGAIAGQAENVDFQTCPVTNQDDGRWSCSYVPKAYTNEIRFILQKTGYAATFPVVPVLKVNLTNLVLVINRGYTVTGLITDHENRPISDVRIKTLEGDSRKRESAKTDENGVFTLSGVAGEAGPYDNTTEPPIETNASGAVVIRGLAGQGRLQVELAFQATGFAPQLRTVELTHATNVVNFQLSPGHILRGKVMDEAGNPIPNAIVQTDWNNQGVRAFDWQSRSDQNGRFEWVSAPEGEIGYWFEAIGYHWLRDIPLPADGTEHGITLKKITANPDPE